MGKEGRGCPLMREWDRLTSWKPLVPRALNSAALRLDTHIHHQQGKTNSVSKCPVVKKAWYLAGWKRVSKEFNWPVGPNPRWGGRLRRVLGSVPPGWGRSRVQSTGGSQEAGEALQESEERSSFLRTRLPVIIRTYEEIINFKKLYR